MRESIERAHNQGTRLQPITQEQLAEIGEVALWRIVLEPYVPAYKGTIITHGVPGVEEANRILSRVGRVLQIGEFAYQSVTAAGLDLKKAKKRAELDQYWLFEQYAGQELELTSGHKLRILNESELLMHIHDPERVKVYL